MLVVITVVAIPLSFVAQRRSWNLRRLAAYKELSARRYQFRIEDPVRDAQFVVSTKPVEQPGHLSKAWSSLCLDDASPKIQSFSSAQWTHSRRESKPQLTNAELKLLADCFPELKHVHLFLESNVTDEGLSHLAALAELDSLSFYQVNGVTGQFLEQFPPETAIRSLSFNELPQLDGRKLGRLAVLPRPAGIDSHSQPRSIR